MSLLRTPPPSRRVRHRNFGYVPTGSLARDAYTWLFGTRNLMKRLQAPDIVHAVGAGPGDAVLDFGCGTGYLTVELAKTARRTVGIDVDERMLRNQVPGFLAGRLEFLRTAGEHLPFADAEFDVVLASEVLPMIPDPELFLKEIARVLRPGGRLVIVNGAGHPAIERAYRRRPLAFRLAMRRRGASAIPDYARYCEVLQAAFGTAQTRFFAPGEVTALLGANGFVVDELTSSPSWAAGAFVSWLQFLRVAGGGSPLATRFFVPKLLVGWVLRRVGTRGYDGGLVCVAHAAGVGR